MALGLLQYCRSSKSKILGYLSNYKLCSSDRLSLALCLLTINKSDNARLATVAVYTVMLHGHGYSYTRRALLSMRTVIQNGVLQ